MLGHQPVALGGGRPSVRPERADPEMVAHGPHVRLLAVRDVLQLVDGRNAITHGSQRSAHSHELLCVVEPGCDGANDIFASRDSVWEHRLQQSVTVDPVATGRALPRAPRGRSADA
jgi:hypothetical protein